MYLIYVTDLSEKAPNKANAKIMHFYYLNPNQKNANATTNDRNLCIKTITKKPGKDQKKLKTRQV